MEPMDLDDDSAQHTATPFSTPRNTESMTYPRLMSGSSCSPMMTVHRSGASSRFAPANGMSCSNPHPSPSAPFPLDHKFCPSATFHGSPSSGFAGAVPAQRSFSREDTPSCSALGFSGALDMTTSDNASLASLEISQASDVSDMEVVPNRPSLSPTWERVRLALSNFSLFQSEADHGQGSPVTSASEAGRQLHGLSTPSTDRCGTSWEPSLSAVQAAAAFKMNKKKGKSSPSKAAMCDCKPVPSVSCGQENEDREDGRRSRSPASTNQLSPVSVSSSTGWRRFCGLPVHLLSFFILLLALALALLLHKRGRVHHDNFANIDTERLKNEMASKVFGQHIALDVIPSSVEQYLSALRARKGKENDDSNSCLLPPLVLSFHGWSGVGKNFVSDIITSSFPTSTLINFLIPYHFPHQDLDEVYESQMEDWILSSVTDYHLHFFVFDEMNKATPGVTRGIENAILKLGHKTFCHSPSIFLFLSNSFGADINKEVFQAMLKNQSRDSLSLHSFAHLFNQSDSEMWYRQLQSQVSVTVPFLPLEKQHVAQCIRYNLVSRQFSFDADLVTRVLKELSITQLASGHEFSQSGCKRVSDKVDLVVFD